MHKIPTNFNILFMMAGAMAIGTVGGSVGVVQMVADFVGPVLGSSSVAMASCDLIHPALLPALLWRQSNGHCPI